MDEDGALKVIEYSLEALLLGWFTYLFAYQNYLLYKWHRGMTLPSKTPALVLGVMVGGAFLAYELWKMLNAEIQGQKEPEESGNETAIAEGENEGIESEENSKTGDYEARYEDPGKVEGKD